MSRYLVCVSDKRHASYDIERDMLAGIGAGVYAGVRLSRRRKRGQKQ